MDKVILYGDSLSTGTHGEGAYLEYIKRELSIKSLMNYAVGSSGMTQATPNHMLSILKKQERDREARNADLILVWHGSNDWYWGSPIGNPGDQDENSFCGAMEKSISILRERNKEALLIWAAPIFRWEKPDGMEWAGNGFLTKNKRGHTLKDYGDAIRSMSHSCQFPVIEIGQAVNIHEYNEKEFLEDHVHPNRAGYDKIQKILAAEIKRYWNYRG